jgi:predicted nucleic acid-binding protein
MKYVLDSSIGFKWLVIEPLTIEARRLRDQYRNAIHELIAPDIYSVEVAHGLTRAERQGRITPQEGAAFLLDLLATLPVLDPSLPLLPKAYAISSQLRIGVYDCLYIALAERATCEFVTADDKLIRMAGPHYPFIIPLSSLP